MNDEQLDKSLKKALTPQREIKEEEIVLKKRRKEEKMMRKHVMAVMMAAAAAMVMAGCSGNSSEASKGNETAKTEAALSLIHICRDSLQGSDEASGGHNSDS